MTRLFYSVLPFLVFAGNEMERFMKLERMMVSCPAQAPFSVKYSRTEPETNYADRRLLPLNTPRGSNIGVCNFKKI